MTTPATPATPATPVTPAPVISMTTDFGAFPEEITAYAQQSLELIAASGFQYIHWCHHWSGDYYYTRSEIEHIAGRLIALGLQMHDLHSPDGRERHWGAPEAHRRRGGVQLIENRVDMAAACGCEVVIVHCPGDYDAAMDRGAAFERLAEGLDELCDYAGARGVRIALENAHTDNFPLLYRAFERFPAEVLGLCYDSGHGHIAGDGPQRLAACAGRLFAVHLHDNDGENDQHKLPMTGGIDWPALMRAIAACGYARPAMTMEISSRNHRQREPQLFMRRARANCTAVLEIFSEAAAAAAAARG